MKKLWSLFLTLALLLACALPVSALAETAPEEYVIDVIVDGALRAYRSDETEIGKVFKEKFGIVLNIIPFSGDWSEKCAMWLVGGDYPEVLQIDDPDVIVNFINAGAALSYDDYADLLPDFFNRYGAMADSARAAADDGKLYYYINKLGAQPTTYNTWLQFIVRSDLLEEQGWPSLLTASEWVEFFKTAKANHPTTEDGLETFVNLPLGETWGNNTLIVPTAEFFTNNHIYAYSYTDETPTVYDVWADNVMMHDFLAFWNELWRNDLLDPESFTDKSDQMAAKANTTQSLAGWYARWMYGNGNRAFVENGTPEYVYVEMPYRNDSNADEPMALALDVKMVPGHGCIMVTQNCKQPERVMELINYLCTSEGAVLNCWGIEGVHYTVDPETGLRDAVPEVVDMYLNDREAWDQQGFACMWNLGWNADQNIDPIDGQVGSIVYSTAVQASAWNERELEAIRETTGDALPWDIFGGEHSRAGNFYVVEDNSWTAGVSIPSEQTDMVDMNQEILDYTYAQIPKVIMAETAEDFEMIFAETIQGRKDMGIDSILELMQSQVDAIVAANAAA